MRTYVKWLVFILLIIIVSTTNAQGLKMKILSKDMKLLAMSTNSSEVLKYLSKGDTVYVFDESEKPFLKVRHYKFEGYIYEEDPKPQTKPSVAPQKSTQSRTYIRGPRGGCYYVNASGKKVYVDHSYCD